MPKNSAGGMAHHHNCIPLCFLYPVKALRLPVIQIPPIIKGIVVGFRFRIKAVSEDEQIFLIAAFRKSLDLLHPVGDEIELFPLGRIALITVVIADDHLERAFDVNQFDDLVRPVMLGVLVLNGDLQIPQMGAEVKFMRLILRRFTKGYYIKQPNMDCQPTEFTALSRHRAVFSWAGKGGIPICGA